MIVRTNGVIWALISLMPLQSAAAQGHLPWKAGDEPPVVAGLHLGDSLNIIESVLGPPADTQKLGDGAWAYSYPAKGLSIVYATLDGAAVIDLRTPQSGAIDSIRTGDSVTAVIRRWGPPDRAEGAVGLYLAGRWLVAVRLNDAHTLVAMLSIGRVAD
jgi:hypothetical protein